MSYLPAVMDLPETSFPVTRVATPGRRRGFVIVLPELWGVVPQILGVAQRYAAEGFEAYVPEILAGTFEPADNQDLLAARQQSADDRQVVRRVTELIRRLRATDASVPILLAGYCFGGRMALHCAARAKVEGVVVYYGSFKSTPNAGGLDVWQSAADIEVPVQAHYGQDDAASPPEELGRLAQVLRRGKVFSYEGAGHAFANETRDSYRHEAAALAWSRTLDFLTERELAYKLVYKAPIVETWELPEHA